MLLIPAGYAQVAFKFQYIDGAEPAIVTLGMNLNGIATTPEGGLDQATTAWATRILPSQSNALIYLGTTSRLGVAAAEPRTIDFPRNQGGGQAFAALTRNTALLVKKITARGGRRGRGRMFVPGAAYEADVDQAGNVAAAARTNWQTAFNLLFADLDALGGGPSLLHDNAVVFSYDPATGKPNYGSAETGPPDPITSFLVDPRVATQRRRMRN